MKTFKFKDPRNGAGIYYILRLVPSYGDLVSVLYSSNPECAVGAEGLTFLHSIEIINND